jgi:hypothetical protein
VQRKTKDAQGVFVLLSALLVDDELKRLKEWKSMKLFGL